jgi:hypothetical protein
MAIKLKIEKRGDEILIVHCCFSISQNELKFYMARSSLTCIAGFTVKCFFPIEEISIFSNSSHLEWRVELSDTILKGTHPRTIPAGFGLICFSGFRGKALNAVATWQ